MEISTFVFSKLLKFTTKHSSGIIQNDYMIVGVTLIGWGEKEKTFLKVSFKVREGHIRWEKERVLGQRNGLCYGCEVGESTDRVTGTSI